MRRINIIFTLLITLFFVGCSNEANEDILDGKGNVDLTLTIAAPQANHTRAIPTDGVTPPSANDEQLADGWAFNHLTLFVVNQKDKKVVAYRDVDYGTFVKPSETFNFAEANEGNLVPPSEGVYELYIVANYQNSAALNTATNNLLKALGKGGTKPSNGLATNNRNWTSFVGQTLALGSDNLADKSLMPLSLKTEILLKPGKNVFDNIQLIRAHSRIIVEVRNESQTKDLQIQNFEFTTNFTSNSIPIFMNGTLPKASAIPNAKSNRALTPFKATNGSSIKHVAPNSIYTAFDGYVLENTASQNGYKFKINVAMEAPTLIKYYEEGAPETSMRDGQTYYIKICEKDGTLKNYMQVNNKNIAVGVKKAPNLENIEDCRKYIFRREGTTIVSVHSEALKKDKFMNGGKSNDEVNFVSTGRALTVQDENIYWAGKSGKTNGFYYIDRDMIWKFTNGGAPGYTRFKFIPVNEATKPGPGTKLLTHTATIPFKYLEDNNPKEVTEINRNGFYHIFINVRHNDQSGAFEFNVAKWNDVIGEIEFN